MDLHLVFALVVRVVAGVYRVSRLRYVPKKGLFRAVFSNALWNPLALRVMQYPEVRKEFCNLLLGIAMAASASAEDRIPLVLDFVKRLHSVVKDVECRENETAFTLVSEVKISGFCLSFRL